MTKTATKQSAKPRASAAKAASKSPAKRDIAPNDARFYVALDRLHPDPKNVRRFGSDAGLAELRATIAARGVINNLLVRPHDKKAGHYYVTAGARRLRALTEIAKAKETIKGAPVGKDYPVAVVLADATDSATELSLIENLARSNMHEADQIEAFRALAEDEKQTPEQIAATFGISHMTVRRRVKLAKVSPRIIEEFRNGAATLQQLEALASCDDHAAQERVWFESNCYSRHPYTLKAALSGDRMRGEHALVRFVTPDAYKAAGGHVAIDLFSDDGEGFYDAELIIRLATERLEGHAKALESEGWAFARYYLSERDCRADALRGVPGIERSDHSEAERQEIDALNNWLNENEPADEIDAEWQAKSDRLDALLALRPSDYPAPWAGIVGAAIYVDNNGQLIRSTGVYLPENAPVRLTGELDDYEAKDSLAVADSATPFSGAIIADLTHFRSVALGNAVAEQTNLALAILVHKMALDLVCRDHKKYGWDYAQRSGATISSERQHYTIKNPDEANNGVFAAFDKRQADWQARLPAKRSDLFQWCLEADHKTLMALMAHCVGATINARVERLDNDATRCGDRIAQAGQVVMPWTPSAGFFARLSKKAMAEAMTEAGVPAPIVAGLAKLPKADAVNTAVAEIRKTGSNWLPLPLRSQPAAEIEDETQPNDEIEDDETED